MADPLGLFPNSFMAKAVTLGQSRFYSGDGTYAVAATTWSTNSADKGTNVVLSNNNLTATSGSAGTYAVRGTNGKTSGKWYFEITCTGTISNSGVGICPGTENIGGASTGPTAYMYPNIANAFMFTSGGTNLGLCLPSALVSSDVLCVATDMTNKRFWVRKGNSIWNNSGTANPTTNVGGFDLSAVFSGNLAAYPVVTFQAINLIHTANFGATTFSQTIPSGFTAWG